MMKKETCIIGNMDKYVVISISKRNISKLKSTIEYGKKNNIHELIILLFGDIYRKNSIVEKEGLIQLVNHLSTDINIKLIREGLGYTLSGKDYSEIFNLTPYKIVSTYDLVIDKFLLHFESDNLENHLWSDEHFSDLLKQANNPSMMKICAVYQPCEDDDWGNKAWHLSQRMDSSLLYLDDGDIVEIVKDDDLKIYFDSVKYLV